MKARLLILFFNYKLIEATAFAAPKDEPFMDSTDVLMGIALIAAFGLIPLFLMNRKK